MSNEAEYDVTSVLLRFLFHSNPLNVDFLFLWLLCDVVVVPPFFMHCTFVRESKGMKNLPEADLDALLPKIIFFSRYVTSSKTASPGLESLINNCYKPDEYGMKTKSENLRKNYCNFSVGCC